jgi:phosphatidylglycerophosphatase C
MNLALFDFDGTITTREMYRDFIQVAVPPRKRAIGTILFVPMVLGYRLGVISGSVIRAAVVAYGLRGITETTMDEIGKRFARDALPGVLRSHAMERIRWHKAQGDRVVVVSGALDVYLSHWCREHELELICTSLEAREGRLTGRHRGRQCVGKEKARRIMQTLDVEAFPTIYAYGDTEDDLDMLGLAHKKFYRWREMG